MTTAVSSVRSRPARRLLSSWIAPNLKPAAPHPDPHAPLDDPIIGLFAGGFALDAVEGRLETGRPRVLFVCVRNAARSQMAAAFATQLGAGRVEAHSAGSAPADEVDPAAVAAMREVGGDVSDAFPKPLADEMVRAADVVVTMGCGDAGPLYPRKRYEDWAIEDPVGQPIDVVRRVRDAIRSQVDRLLSELAAPSA
jgi:arsenate reductase (thioredoxin)